LSAREITEMELSGIKTAATSGLRMPVAASAIPTTLYPNEMTMPRRIAASARREPTTASTKTDSPERVAPAELGDALELRLGRLTPTGHFCVDAEIVCYGVHDTLVVAGQDFEAIAELA
jgi:hypothetical protein